MNRQKGLPKRTLISPPLCNPGKKPKQTCNVSTNSMWKALRDW